MMRHPEHHIPPTMRATRLMPQMAAPQNSRSRPILMTISSAVPVPHSGVLVSMPQGPALITTTSIPPHQTQPQAQQQQQQQQQQAKPIYHQSEEGEPPEEITTNTNTCSILPENNLANSKEKTPMCLINELARCNKIQLQYRLTGEQGPAHKKLFTVTLKLGNEEYEAEGTKIKKAQHAAAALALQRTKYRHPMVKMKVNRNKVETYSGLGPTVELNALAMKRGECTVYVIENAPQSYAPLPSTPNYPSQPGFYPRVNMYGPGHPRYGFDPRRAHNPRNYHPQYDARFYPQYRFQQPSGELFSVRLRVGDREYPGVGYTAQAARHDAAAKAIEDIKQRELDENQQQCNDATATVTPNTDNINTDLNSELKSPISLVHEIALKRNLNVSFEVLSEKGPPHMKVFVTRCRVGDFVAEAEGNGKKISKKRAAEKMLEELVKLAPLPTSSSSSALTAIKRKRVVNRKKQRNLIKVNEENGNDLNEEINPISRLIQIQQANKEREPVYTVIEERGAPRRREFVIEASVGVHSASGVGPKKKVAKRNAAEALLALMGHVTTSSSSSSSSTTSSNVLNNNQGTKLQTDKEPEVSEKIKKVTFHEEKVEANVGGSGGRQLVPGLLLVNDQSGAFLQKNKTKPNEAGNSEVKKSTLSTQTSGAATSTTSSATLASPPKTVRAKEQLLYLTHLLGVHVQFSDFPKSNHEQYLTLVSMNTSPPQVCHGEGPTTEASHEKAALEALTVLSELGLDNVTPGNDEDDEELTSEPSPPLVPNSGGGGVVPNGVDD